MENTDSEEYQAHQPSHHFEMELSLLNGCLPAFIWQKEKLSYCKLVRVSHVKSFDQLTCHGGCRYGRCCQRRFSR